MNYLDFSICFVPHLKSGYNQRMQLQTIQRFLICVISRPLLNGLNFVDKTGWGLESSILIV